MPQPDLHLPAVPPQLFKILSAGATGSDVNTAQPWFPSGGGVTVEASKTYLMEGMLLISRAAGANSHTTGLLFGGTATLTNISYHALCRTTDAAANAALNSTYINVATNTTVKAASVSTTEQICIEISGIVRTNAAGTFIPQFQYSAAPGGAPTILTNSYFCLTPIGTSSVTERGVWA